MPLTWIVSGRSPWVGQATERATVRETLQVEGIRCERCVMRLAKMLGRDRLEAANATLIGQVTVVYDDGRTTREALIGQMARGGFRERQTVCGAAAGNPPRA